MDNLIKRIAAAECNCILIHNLGKKNEKFELIKKLKEKLGTVTVYTNDDFAEYLITSLYEKNDPVETFYVNANMVVFYDVDFMTNKPGHIKIVFFLTHFLSSQNYYKLS